MNWAQCFHILCLDVSECISTNKEIILCQETKNISLPMKGKEAQFFFFTIIQKIYSKKPQ